MTYYDTGIILKLYTEEPESEAARAYVVERKAPLYLTDLHFAECTSALRLKEFRGEAEPGQIAAALGHLEEDLGMGSLKWLPVDWEDAWKRCRVLSHAHAGKCGCRTLDALHVACAMLHSARAFVSTDRRQLTLAELAGLRAINPVRN